MEVFFLSWKLEVKTKTHYLPSLI